MAEPSEWARLPSAKECIPGGARKKFVRRPLPRLTNLFREVPGKQNDAVPPGAGLAPKRDPEQRTGYEAVGSQGTGVALIAFRPAEVRVSSCPDARTVVPLKDGFL
jgi:hypothetical protein